MSSDGKQEKKKKNWEKENLQRLLSNERANSFLFLNGEIINCEIGFLPWILSKHIYAEDEVEPLKLLLSFTFCGEELGSFHVEHEP